MTYTHIHARLRLVQTGEPAGSSHDETASETAPQFTRNRSLALCRLVESTASAAFGVRLPDMRAPTRCRAHIAFARQVAMYLAHVSFGLTYTAIGRCFERDRTTVAHGCRLVEDRRDDPGLDTSLDYLEAAVRLCADRIDSRHASASGAGRAAE